MSKLFFIQGLLKLNPNLTHHPYFPVFPFMWSLLHTTHTHQTISYPWPSVLGMSPPPPPPDDEHTEKKGCVLYYLIMSKPCPAQFDIHQFPHQQLWIRPKDSIITQDKYALENFILAKSYRKDGSL